MAKKKSTQSKAVVKAKLKSTSKSASKASTKSGKAAKPAKKAKAATQAGKTAKKAKPAVKAKALKKATAPKTKTAIKVSAKAAQKTAAAVAPKKAAVKAADWDQFLSPLDDRLLVQLAEVERRTAGGLYIPDTAVISGNQRGLVVAAGPGHKNKKGRIRPMDVKAGDTVVFSEFVGTKMNLNGIDVQLLRESEILGIVEG